MHVLLTGGAGFIGSHLTDALIKDGHRVTVIDNFCSGQQRNVQHLMDNDRFTLLKQDVLDPIDIDRELDYILHFASRASPPDYQDYPVHTLRTNSEGTVKLLELARKHDAQFMYSSTSEVYGDPQVHPQHEEYWGNVNPVGPRACYDEGKRFGEAAITSFARQHDLDWRIIRIFNTYGPRMRADDGRVVTNFVTQALNDDPITVYGDGSQTRSFCYIDDMVRGIRAVMDGPSEEIFNLGNPDEYQIIELAEKIQRMVDTDSEIVHKELPADDPEKRRPDIAKANEQLDWEPSVPLEDGIEQTVSYFRNR